MALKTAKIAKIAKKWRFFVYFRVFGVHTKSRGQPRKSFRLTPKWPFLTSFRPGEKRAKNHKKNDIFFEASQKIVFFGRDFFEVVPWIFRGSRAEVAKKGQKWRFFVHFSCTLLYRGVFSRFFAFLTKNGLFCKIKGTTSKIRLIGSKAIFRKNRQSPQK